MNILEILITIWITNNILTVFILALDKSENEFGVVKVLIVFLFSPIFLLLMIKDLVFKKIDNTG